MKGNKMKTFKAVQGSNSLNDREIELLHKEVWKKRKEVFNSIDWYIMWVQFNNVAEELVSSESQNISYPTTYLFDY